MSQATVLSHDEYENWARVRKPPKSRKPQSFVRQNKLQLEETPTMKTQSDDNPLRLPDKDTSQTSLQLKITDGNKTTHIVKAINYHHPWQVRKGKVLKMEKPVALIDMESAQLRVSHSRKRGKVELVSKSDVFDKVSDNFLLTTSMPKISYQSVSAPSSEDKIIGKKLNVLHVALPEIPPPSTSSSSSRPKTNQNPSSSPVKCLSPQFPVRKIRKAEECDNAKVEDFSNAYFFIRNGGNSANGQTPVLPAVKLMRISQTPLIEQRAATLLDLRPQLTEQKSFIDAFPRPKPRPSRLPPPPLPWDDKGPLGRRQLTQLALNRHGSHFRSGLSYSWKVRPHGMYVPNDR